MFTAWDPGRILDKLEKRSLKRIRSDRGAADIEPEEERLLKEDLRFWDSYLPPENFVTTELRREFGEEYFDLLNDRAMVLGNEPPVRELRIGEGTFSLRVLRDVLCDAYGVRTPSLKTLFLRQYTGIHSVKDAVNV